MESLLEGVSKTLKKGGSVTLVGFEPFKTAGARRMGRNPQTGAAVRIPKRKVARFTAGKALKDLLN
jgi:DNA-binding protein HU-beta